MKKIKSIKGQRDLFEEETVSAKSRKKQDLIDHIKLTIQQLEVAKKFDEKLSDSPTMRKESEKSILKYKNRLEELKREFSIAHPADNLEQYLVSPEVIEKKLIAEPPERWTRPYSKSDDEFTEEDERRLREILKNK